MSVTNKQIKLIAFLAATANQFYKSQGFLTYEEAKERVRSKGNITVHHANTEVGEAYFFSDNHIYGYKDEYNKIDFVPVSHSGFPTRVAARPGLESGIIQNLDDMILVFYKNSRFLSSYDELIDYITENNLFKSEHKSFY